MTDRGIDAFVAAITGDTGAAAAVITAYTDLLAARLGGLLGALPVAGRDPINTALESADRLPGGMLAALTWPPVAASLLDRRAITPSATQLAEEMCVGAELPFAAEPRHIETAQWLDEQTAGRYSWLPHTAADASAGWSLMRSGAPSVAAVARTTTRVVLSRGTAVNGSTGSWSSDELIGCTVLIGPRTDDDASLADCLLHEAVHHCQGMTEAIQPFIRDPDIVRSEHRYPSPWSGAQLTAKSLLAACFVWFALADFWSRARSPDLTARAVHGFVHGDPAAMVDSFAHALDPDVVPVVRALQSQVRRRFRT